MKKLFAVIFMILTISCLSACAEPPTAPTEFSAVFHVDRGDVDHRGTVTVNGDGITIEMTAPGGAKGLSFCYTGEGLSIGYAGHSTMTNADYIPTDAAPSALYRALAYLPEARYLATEDGEDRFALPSPAHEAVLITRDGAPVSLSCPDTGLEFSFRQS